PTRSGWFRRGVSDDANLLGFFALSAGRDLELDGVTLVERLVATAFDVGEVDEHVAGPFSRDEAEALLGVEKLHCASGHCMIPSKDRAAPRRLGDDPTVWNAFLRVLLRLQ